MSRLPLCVAKFDFSNFNGCIGKCERGTAEDKGKKETNNLIINVKERQQTKKKQIPHDKTGQGRTTYT